MIARKGSKSKYLSREEEEAIVNRFVISWFVLLIQKIFNFFFRVLEESPENGISFSRLKELFWGDVMSIIAKCPEREEMLLKLDPNTSTSFLSQFASRHKLRRSKEKTVFECEVCQIKFWSNRLLLQHQTEVHNQLDEEPKEEINSSKVDEIGDGSSDEENYLLPESEDTRRDSDFSKVYKALEQRVQELEEEKVENPTTEREKSKNERIDKKIRCERALAALLR